MKDIKFSDEVEESEKRFIFPDLLSLEFFDDYKDRYKWQKQNGAINPYRSYLELLRNLNEIHDYNEQHANKFAKALENAGKDTNNSEAIFAEIIVYRHYIRMVYEGLLKSIELANKECDLVIQKLDGSKVYYEIFCVTPKMEIPREGEIVVRDIKTHTQDAFSSIRQKLLAKMKKQRQMIKVRENYAVIELNDGLIAGDFSILSSLSSGYKITFDRMTGKKVSEGYDWSKTVFDDEATINLKGIIYFSLGNYGSRKYIFNPNYRPATTEPRRADGRAKRAADA